MQVSIMSSNHVFERSGPEAEEISIALVCAFYRIEIVVLSSYNGRMLSFMLLTKNPANISNEEGYCAQTLKPVT